MARIADLYLGTRLSIPMTRKSVDEIEKLLNGLSPDLLAENLTTKFNDLYHAYKVTRKQINDLISFTETRQELTQLKRADYEELYILLSVKWDKDKTRIDELSQEKKTVLDELNKVIETSEQLKKTKENELDTIESTFRDNLETLKQEIADVKTKQWEEANSRAQVPQKTEEPGSMDIESDDDVNDIPVVDNNSGTSTDVEDDPMTSIDDDKPLEELRLKEDELNTAFTKELDAFLEKVENDTKTEAAEARTLITNEQRSVYETKRADVVKNIPDGNDKIDTITELNGEFKTILHFVILSKEIGITIDKVSYVQKEVLRLYNSLETNLVRLYHGYDFEIARIRREIENSLVEKNEWYTKFIGENNDRLQRVNQEIQIRQNGLANDMDFIQFSYTNTKDLLTPLKEFESDPELSNILLDSSLSLDDRNKVQEWYMNLCDEYNRFVKENSDELSFVQTRGKLIEAELASYRDLYEILETTWIGHEDRLDDLSKEKKRVMDNLHKSETINDDRELELTNELEKGKAKFQVAVNDMKEHIKYPNLQQDVDLPQVPFQPPKPKAPKNQQQQPPSQVIVVTETNDDKFHALKSHALHSVKDNRGKYEAKIIVRSIDGDLIEEITFPRIKSHWFNGVEKFIVPFTKDITRTYSHESTAKRRDFIKRIGKFSYTIKDKSSGHVISSSQSELTYYIMASSNYEVVSQVSSRIAMFVTNEDLSEDMISDLFRLRLVLIDV
jgi:hypothetical protein